MINQKLTVPIVVLGLLLGLLSATAAENKSKKDSLISLQKNTKTPKEKVKLYVELSKYYSQMDLDSSFYYSFMAMELSKKIDYSTGVGLSMSSLGTLHVQNDSLLLALEYLDESLDFIEDCDCDSLKAEVYLAIGQIHYLHDNYFDAQEFFIRSLQLAEKKALNVILFELYTWMADMYNTMENIDDAEFYYLKSLEYSDTIVHDYNTVLSFYNLGNFYENKGELSTAKIYIRRAIDIAQKKQFYLQYPALYNEIGHIEYNSGNYKKALEYYQMAEESIADIDSANLLNIKYWSAYAAFNIGKCYYKLGNYRMAIDLFNKARIAALRKNLIRLGVMASEYLGKSHERLGKYDIALGFYKDYFYLHDSIMSVQNVTRVTKLEMDYRYMKEFHKKRVKRLEMERAYTKTVHRYKMLAVIGILTLFIVILFFVIYRNKQRAKTKQEKLEQEKLKVEKDLLEKDLEFKDRELTTSMIYLLKKNNFLHDITKELKVGINQNKHSNVKAYRDIVNRLNASLGKDAWDEFEARFNSVHQSFSCKLVKDFPELTPNELKLCSFLKLNMTTKDIETITFQSNNTITVARHRLRLKLKLDRDDNLVTFLSKY